MKEILSENLIKLSNEFLKEESRLYVVGGYVRNYLLGLPLSDIDVCGALNFEKVKAICEKLGFECKEINKRLGTLLIVVGEEKYEYTPFRTENYVLGKHSPESVEWTDDIKVDARRRDFTCNALYYDIANDDILDFYDGIEDIINKSLKAIETPEWVFSSDGLRILRLVRFACSLGFEIDRKTFKVARKMLYQLKYISGERKTAELKEIFNAHIKYSREDISLKLLNKFNIYPYIIGMPNIPRKINLRKYYKVFSKCENKFLAFVYILLLSKYGKQNVTINQIVFDLQTLVNDVLHAGGDIKEMSKTLYVISRMQKDRDSLEMCVMYSDLKYESRQIVKSFCDTRMLVEKINQMKAQNIPLNLDQLQISNVEIMEIVPKETISYVKNLLLQKCQNGIIPNEHDALIKAVKNLNQPNDSIEVK